MQTAIQSGQMATFNPFTTIVAKIKKMMPYRIVTVQDHVIRYQSPVNLDSLIKSGDIYTVYHAQKDLKIIGEREKYYFVKDLGTQKIHMIGKSDPLILNIEIRERQFLVKN